MQHTSCPSTIATLAHVPARRAAAGNRAVYYPRGKGGGSSEHIFFAEAQRDSTFGCNNEGAKLGQYSKSNMPRPS
jgi:hypothetical protein